MQAIKEGILSAILRTMYWNLLLVSAECWWWLTFLTQFIELLKNSLTNNVGSRMFWICTAAPDCMFTKAWQWILNDEKKVMYHEREMTVEHFLRSFCSTKFFPLSSSHEMEYLKVFFVLIYFWAKKIVWKTPILLTVHVYNMNALVDWQLV